MMTETSKDTTVAGVEQTRVVAAGKEQQTATITLTASGSTMQIVAERKADAARTYVITTDAAKVSARGMTEAHATFEIAKAHAEKLAKGATKAGWTRKAARRGFVAKVDAFSSLPAAPKAAKK